MSADLLREAATEMRGEAVAVRRPYARDEHFKIAVADLLDHAAARAETKVRLGGDSTAVWSHEKYALTVARAYLGRDA